MNSQNQSDNLYTRLKNINTTYYQIKYHRNTHHMAKSDTTTTLIKYLFIKK